MQPLKIAVNTRFLIRNKLEGIGWFTYETLKRICKTNPDVEFHFLFDRKYSADFIFSDNIVPHVIMPQARHPILWKWWFEISLPNFLNHLQPKLFLSPDGFLSLKSNIPSALVIHDLAFEHYPQFMNKTVARYYRQNTPKYASKAARIATVSEFSKMDIHRRYGVDTEKIDVVYNGANEIFKPVEDAEKLLIKTEHTQGQEYFIYTGAIHPRKNIKRLLIAFDRFKKNTGSRMKLVLAGRQAWMYEDILNTYKNMDHRVDVIMKGHLDQQILSKLIAAATAMVYVSLFEGFGIPIIEAMQSDVPVITSNTSSMAEIGADAALLVDPTSIDQIADAMQKTAEDEKIHSNLIEKGRKRSESFSWDKTAGKLWESVEKVIC